MYAFYSKVWFVLYLPEDGIELFNRLGILRAMKKIVNNRYENSWQGWQGSNHVAVTSDAA
jgi:hypothetical protein